MGDGPGGNRHQGSREGESCHHGGRSDSQKPQRQATVSAQPTNDRDELGETEQ